MRDRSIGYAVSLLHAACLLAEWVKARMCAPFDHEDYWENPR